MPLFYIIIFNSATFLSSTSLKNPVLFIILQLPLVSRRNGMDASHPVRAENKLSLGPVTSGDRRPSAPGARDRAVGVAKGEVDPHGPTTSKCPRGKIRRSSQANRRVRDEY
jgi:hypothetical protein